MDQAIKSEWTAALRSGRYTQGTSTLRFSSTIRDEYCCLGVLCDLAVKAGAIPRPVRTEVGDYAYGDARRCAFLPTEVQEWAGIDSPDGEFVVDSGKRRYSLAERNDDGADFHAIADIIDTEF